MQHSHGFDVHEAAAMGARLGLEQLPKAPTLPRMRREGFHDPDVGDDIDQGSGDFGRPVGIGAVAGGAATTEQAQGGDTKEHKEAKSDDEMPFDGREYR